MLHGSDRDQHLRIPFPLVVEAYIMVMGKVKLGVSDLWVSRYGLGSMTWGIQNTEEEAYVSLLRIFTALKGQLPFGTCAFLSR